MEWWCWSEVVDGIRCKDSDEGLGMGISRDGEEGGREYCARQACEGQLLQCWMLFRDYLAPSRRQKAMSCCFTARDDHDAATQ